MARLTTSPRIPFPHFYLGWATKEIIAAGRRETAASLWCIHVDADQLTQSIKTSHDLGKASDVSHLNGSVNVRPGDLSLFFFMFMNKSIKMLCRLVLAEPT